MNKNKLYIELASRRLFSMSLDVIAFYKELIKSIEKEPKYKLSPASPLVKEFFKEETKLNITSEVIISTRLTKLGKGVRNIIFVSNPKFKISDLEVVYDEIGKSLIISLPSKYIKTKKALINAFTMPALFTAISYKILLLKNKKGKFKTFLYKVLLSESNTPWMYDSAFTAALVKSLLFLNEKGGSFQSALKSYEHFKSSIIENKVFNTLLNFEKLNFYNKLKFKVHSYMTYRRIKKHKEAIYKLLLDVYEVIKIGGFEDVSAKKQTKALADFLNTLSI